MQQIEGIVKAKAWNLVLLLIVLVLVLTPFVLVQLLRSEPGTTWRTIRLDVVFVLVLAVEWHLIVRILKALPPLAQPLRVLVRAFAFAFQYFSVMFVIGPASFHDREILAPAKMPSMFAASFLGVLTVMAVQELWSHRKQKAT
jgi:hypothetical protein